MQGHWLRNTLIISGTFACVWLATIFSWQADSRLPNALDVAIFFVVIPLALLIIFWLSHKIWQFVILRNNVSAPATLNTSNDDKTKVDDFIDEQERYLTLNLVSAAIRTLHGNSPNELIARINENKTTFELDQELTDSSGFPMLTGRIPNIDISEQLQALQQWADSSKIEMPEWTPEQLRAITHGGQVVIELALQATEHAELDSFIFNAIADRDKQFFPVLQVIPLFPTHWSPKMCEFVGGWFEYLIRQQGWPSENIALLSVSNLHSTDTFATIDRLLVDFFRKKQPCIAMAIACDSNIGLATIEHWESLGKLPSSHRNGSIIPGEGAAGLLLADQQQSKLLTTEPTAQLHRVALGQHNQSTDGKERISDQVLVELVENVLLTSHIPAEKITFIASDTDHQVGKIIELMQMGTKIFPELDPITNYTKVANACGTMGSVAGLITLALGHHEAVSNDGTSICLSNLDDYQRAAVVVSSEAIAPESLTQHT